jgi:hypothetical protein
LALLEFKIKATHKIYSAVDFQSCKVAGQIGIDLKFYVTKHSSIRQP